jgi:hypothetical protein
MEAFDPTKPHVVIGPKSTTIAPFRGIDPLDVIYELHPYYATNMTIIEDNPNGSSFIPSKGVQNIGPSGKVRKGNLCSERTKKRRKRRKRKA